MSFVRAGAFLFVLVSLFVGRDARAQQSSLSISDVTLLEGNAGTTAFTFTLTLNQPSTPIVTVNYATADGTATAGSDYTAASGTVTFASQQTTQTITVLVNGDRAIEPNETFFVNLTADPLNVTIADAQGMGTITNDDTQPTVTIGNASVFETDTGTADASFTVTLSSASTDTISVSYATSNGTATAGADYTTTSGTLQFAPGVTSQTITVPVVGDLTYESDETFLVTLSAPVNTSLGDPAQGTGTILDNEGQSGLSIGDVSAAEGNSGFGTFVFTVSLSPVSASTVTVNYATADATALAGADYVANSGTLTFAPGEVSKTVTVAIVGDTIFERDTYFTVNLSDPSGADLARGTGAGLILNDDAVPALLMSAASASEGDGAVSFTVTLSQVSSLVVRVDYATANKTAIAGKDYTATSGTLTISPGSTTGVVQVPIINDTDIEGDETFTFTLARPLSASIAVSSVEGTIIDDDSANSAGGDPTPDEPGSSTKDDDDGGCQSTAGASLELGMVLFAIALRGRARRS